MKRHDRLSQGGWSNRQQGLDAMQVVILKFKLCDYSMSMRMVLCLIETKSLFSINAFQNLFLLKTFQDWFWTTCTPTPRSMERRCLQQKAGSLAFITNTCNFTAVHVKFLRVGLENNNNFWHCRSLISANFLRLHWWNECFQLGAFYGWLACLCVALWLVINDNCSP